MRLRYAYVIRCDEVVKGEDGRVVELRCSYDPETRSGVGGSRKGIGTIHWVSAQHALDAEVRLYDRLFTSPNPDDLPEDAELDDVLNRESLVVRAGVKVEPSVAHDPPDTRYQFERTGYFWRDPADGVGDALVFNRIVTLRDTWAKRVEPGSGAAGIEGRAPDVSVERKPRVQSTAPGAKPRISSERAGKRRADPELAARMERYVGELGLAAEDADVLTGSRGASDFFEAAIAIHQDPPTVASWITNELRGLLGDRRLVDLEFGGDALGRLAGMVADGAVSRRAAKDVLAEMVARGGEPAEVVRRLGLEKVADAAALEPVVARVLEAWPEKVAEYRAGRKNLMGLFVGEAMKATKGAADPKAVRALLTDRLENGP